MPIRRKAQRLIPASRSLTLCRLCNGERSTKEASARSMPNNGMVRSGRLLLVLAAMHICSACRALARRYLNRIDDGRKKAITDPRLALFALLVTGNAHRERD